MREKTIAFHKRTVGAQVGSKLEDSASGGVFKLALLKPSARSRESRDRADGFFCADYSLASCKFYIPRTGTLFLLCNKEWLAKLLFAIPLK